MIASMPMYDLPGGDWRVDLFWTELRDTLRQAGVDAPDTLTRSGDPHADWNRKDLLLSQTCGLPFRVQLHDRLTLVAAPALWVPGQAPGDHGPHAGDRPTSLPPGRYYSVIVARKDDPRKTFADFDGAKLAFNDALSQSGWGLMHAHARTHGVRFATGLRTGAHRASALSVFKGRADIAAIDVATWHGPLAVERWRDGLKIVDRTALSPALPYVTAYPDLQPLLFDALKSVLSYAYDPDTPPPLLAEALNIAPEGVVPAERADYMAIQIPPDPPTPPI